jgi:predicted small lipoprotein YifL
MKRILALAVLSLSLAGCVYGGPGPSYGYYGGSGGYG